ncbi:MAG: MFS transporter, partial [Anaerolineales bacterium]|nr:MFS transporter [Anaerolineales bacterium]
MDNRTSSSLGIWLKKGTGRAFNWLLDNNRAVKKLDDQEFSAEVEHNYRWNYVFNVLDGATFWFGASFYSLTTIGPLFISKLTDNPVPLGILAIISQAGWAFPQLFAANSTERFGRMKPLVVRLGFILERFPMFVMFLAAIIAIKSPLAALLVFILGAAWHSIGAGVIAPAWQTMLARIIPVARRGRFMAFTMFLGAGTGLLGTQVSAWLLDTQPFPNSFIIIFLIAALFINLSWVFIAFTREPIPARQAPEENNHQYMASLKKIVRQDVNFRRFLISRGLSSLAGMGTGFVTVAAIQRWDVPDGTVGYYTMTMLIGQTVANLLLGWLADKYGHKLVLELGTLGVTIGFAVAWL